MKNLFIIFICFLIILSCNNNEKSTYQPKKIDNSGWEDTLEIVNKSLIITDKERIQAYVKRRNWNVIETESGLFYQIYEKGKGEKAKTGQTGKIKYRIELLDGTYCYSSDSTGYKMLRIGMGRAENGLDETLKLMHKGDKARVILLPHLAHGLLGDFEKIPARSTIVYDIEIIDLIDF